MNVSETLTIANYYKYNSSSSDELYQNPWCPSDVIIIGEGAFYSNDLISVDLPDNLITIGATSFSQNRLTSITIPETVTTIYMDAFFC